MRYNFDCNQIYSYEYYKVLQLKKSYKNVQNSPKAILCEGPGGWNDARQQSPYCSRYYNWQVVRVVQPLILAVSCLVPYRCVRPPMPCTSTVPWISTVPPGTVPCSYSGRLPYCTVHRTVIILEDYPYKGRVKDGCAESIGITAARLQRVRLGKALHSTVLGGAVAP